jgi:hypothetical protein
MKFLHPWKLIWVESDPSEPGIVVHSYNPSTLEAEAKVSWVQGQPGLHSKTKQNKKVNLRIASLEMEVGKNFENFHQLQNAFKLILKRGHLTYRNAMSIY